MEISEKLTNPSLNESILSPEDSPAPTQATQEEGPELPESTPGDGSICSESFALYDPLSCSWRTHQACLLGGWELFSEVWPRAGTMRNGNVYRLPPLVPNRSAPESLFWPTLVARDRHSLNKLLRGDGAVAGGTPLIVAIAKSLWPTLSARDWKGTSAASWRRGNPSPDTLPDAVADSLGLPIEKTVHLSPGFCEEFMGFPIGWTALEPLETP